MQDVFPAATQGCVCCAHLLILIAKFSITAYELIYELSHT